MNSKYLFIPVLFLLAALTASAQRFTIAGKVTSSTGNVVANPSVSLKATNYLAVADSSGNYAIKDIKPGTYLLKVSAVGYMPATENINVNRNLTANVVLELSVQQLKDVNVNAGKDNSFGVTRLKAVEGTTINAGKKSEVIILDDVIANKASTN